MTPRPVIQLERWVREVPGFPKPGIVFKDLSPLMADPEALDAVLDAWRAAPALQLENTMIVGIEARGFIFGAALAARLRRPFVPMRKAGKLPGPVDRIDYDLEYGAAALELGSSAIPAEARVVIVDDVLATGGTAAAAAALVRRQGASVQAMCFVLELAALGGAAKLGGVATVSVITC